MKLSFKIVLICLLLIKLCVGQDQNRAKIDSLKGVLVTDIHDTTRILTLSRLGLAYQNSKDSALPVYKKAMRLAQKINDPLYIGDCYMNFASVYYFSGEYDIAIKYVKKVTEVYESNGYEKEYINALNNLGVLYRKLGNYPKALECYQKKLAYFKGTDNHEDLSELYNNIANLYSSYGDLKKAKSYQLKSIKERSYVKDQVVGLASNYNNLAMLYQKEDNPDSALFYYRKAFRLMKNKQLRFYGNLANNIGTIFKSMNEDDSAFYYLKISLKHRDSVQYFHGMAQSRNNLVSLYVDRGQPEVALQYANEAYNISKKYNYPDEEILSHKNLSILYEQKGKYKKSLYHVRRAIKIKDSVENKDDVRKLAQLEMKYKYEQERISDSIRQANEDKLMALQNEAEKRKQKMYLWAAIIVGLLVLIIAAVIYRNYRKQARANIVITEKSDQIQIQKEHLEEKNNEITDSLNYAKRIQATILPDQKKIQQQLPNSFVLYQPKDIVSGDFYWIEEEDGKTYVAAADCTGHGVPGAMVSVVCSNALTKALKEHKLLTPNLILDQAHQDVIDQFKTNDNSVKDGMDIALVSLEKRAEDQYSLCFSGANNPLWIITQNSKETITDQLKNNVFKVTTQGDLNLIEVKPDKIAIGQHDINEKYTLTSLQLQKNDRIYQFSDGFADQFGGDNVEARMKGGKKLKSTNFKKLLLSIQDQKMEVQKTTLNQYFSDWRGELEQIDDVCVIGVRL